MERPLLFPEQPPLNLHITTPFIENMEALSFIRFAISNIDNY